LVGWWVGGLVGWWVGGLVGWWVGGLVGWWVGGLNVAVCTATCALLHHIAKQCSSHAAASRRRRTPSVLTRHVTKALNPSMAWQPFYPLGNVGLLDGVQGGQRIIQDWDGLAVAVGKQGNDFTASSWGLRQTQEYQGPPEL
jgi:hypothetical protein